MLVVVCAHVFALPEQLDGLDEEIVEIERVVVDEPLLVELEDAGDGGALFVAVFDAGGVQLGILAVVLGMADCALRRRGASRLSS